MCGKDQNFMPTLTVLRVLLKQNAYVLPPKKIKIIIIKERKIN